MSEPSSSGPQSQSADATERSSTLANPFLTLREIHKAWPLEGDEEAEEAEKLQNIVDAIADDEEAKAMARSIQDADRKRWADEQQKLAEEAKLQADEAKAEADAAEARRAAAEARWSATVNRRKAPRPESEDLYAYDPDEVEIGSDEEEEEEEEDDDDDDDDGSSNPDDDEVDDERFLVEP